jgi:uncharacterized protein
MELQTRSNRVFVLVIVAMFVAGLVMLPGRAQNPVSAQVPQETPMNRTVSVNGSGSSQVQPDVAVIILGVETQADTASEALNQNSQQMQALVNTLRTGGIAQADIRTRTIQLYPRYSNQQPSPTGQVTTPEIIGYIASNTVEIRVRNLNNVGSVLDQAVEAGGNRIDNIRFEVSNQSQQLDQARTAAMQDATHKAEQLADLANAELGQVITITEFSRVPLPFQDGMMAERAMADVPVSPGMETITVEVQVTWELQ